MEQIGASSCHRILKNEDCTPELLIHRYTDALVRFAYGYVRDSAAAEDAAADAIATLLFKRKRFDSEPQLRAYLYKVTRSRCVDELRRRGRSDTLEDLEHILVSEDVADIAQRRMQNAAVYVCMQQLPDAFREVLQLHYFDDFDLPQVAKIMKKDMKQVYNLHARAKIALRKLLEQEGIHHENF